MQYDPLLCVIDIPSGEPTRGFEPSFWDENRSPLPENAVNSGFTCPITTRFPLLNDVPLLGPRLKNQQNNE